MSLKKALMGESRKDRFKSVPKKIKDGAPAWHFSFMDDRKKGEKLPIFIIGPKRIELDEMQSCQGEIQREGDTYYLSYIRGGVKLNGPTQKAIRNGFKGAGLSGIQLQFSEEHHQRIPDELRAVPDSIAKARSYIGNWGRWKEKYPQVIQDDPVPRTDKDKILARWLDGLLKNNCTNMDEDSARKVETAIMHFRERVVEIIKRKEQAAAAARSAATSTAAAAPTNPDYQG